MEEITDKELFDAGIIAFENSLNMYNVLDHSVAKKMRRIYKRYATDYIHYRRRILSEFEWKNQKPLNSCSHIPDKIKSLITNEVCFKTKDNLMASEYRLLLSITKINNIWYCNDEKAFNIHFPTLHDMMTNYYCFFDDSIMYDMRKVAFEQILGI